MKLTVMLQCLPIQCVQHGMACSVSYTRRSVGLSSVTVFQALATQRSLVYETILGPTEWHPIFLKLTDSSWRLLTHVVNGVLVSKPVIALDSVVHMPSPVILGHVARSSIDTTLRCNRVRPGWK